ncbi:M48 family metalloprotease [Leptothermofonsia sp. ETS-13]|uniref:M48 family metalloprotease n=1 Tax=Leptothermofonsia sp. ETS-13 TaxID=3035696 RepID=UPI003BA10811
MPPVPDSSTPSAKALNDAEAGLAAVKQGDYPEAIALLETISLPPNHPLNLKAQMGLVVAYTRNSNPQKAITLCQTLYKSGDSQVKEWASRTLENLARRFPQFPVEATASGNIETSKPGGMESQTVSEVETEVDLTGFIPFDGSSVPRQSVVLDDAESPDGAITATENSATGFVPLQVPSHSTSPEEPQNSPTAEEFSDATPSLSLISTSSQEGRSAAPAYSTLHSPAPLPIEELLSYRPGWQQAPRAKQWNPLGKVDISWLLLTQAGTAIALFWVLQQIVYLANLIWGIAITKIPFLHLQRVIPEYPVWSIVIPLVFLFLASRWLLDGLLTMGHGLQPLSLNQLSNYSPETVKAISRYCRQRRVPMPTLGIIPTLAPVAFSYGVLPQFTRLVVSQGLLEQLEDDEIATVYASEIGHIAHWDVPLMSLLTVVNQIPFTIYALVSDWGNRQQMPLVRGLAIAVSTVSYGLYSLTRWIGLWLSRQRVYYSDHSAADLTGNPNGFTRALLKIAIGTAKAVEHEGQTSYLLEGFELLTPLSHRMATTLGSLYHHTSLERVLEWEWTNPYRHWLSLPNSHPPTGDRLRLQARYARYWRLPTELEFNPDLEAKASPKKKSSFTAAQWRTLLLQGAPFFGLAFGLLLALTLSLIGWLGVYTNANSIAWMYGDRAIFQGLPLIGFSLGTFIRINPSFPDLKLPVDNGQEFALSLPELLNDPATIPIDSTPVRLEGKLLGRPGISNLLSQDLLLKTATGIVRLHCISPLGPIGNLFPRQSRFTGFIQQDLTATGWFRRGAAPWIDVDHLCTQSGRVDRSNHPVWATVLGLLTATWGILIIAFGSNI